MQVADYCRKCKGRHIKGKRTISRAIEASQQLKDAPRIFKSRGRNLINNLKKLSDNFGRMELAHSRRDSVASSSTVSLDDLLLESPATRMSWFLVEVDEGIAQGKPATGRIAYAVLHAMELIEEDFTEKYVSRIIKFRKNGQTIKAKLIMASDERSLIDGALQGIKRELELQRKHRQKERESSTPTVLIQYNECTGVLVQKLIKQDDIKSRTGADLSRGDTVLIPPYQVSQVLHVNDDIDYMEKVLLDTKGYCFDMANSEEVPRIYTDLDHRALLLVAMSPTPTKTVYRIISYKDDTIWQERNLHKEVIAYMRDGDDVVQVIVLAHSDDREVLLQVLKQVEEACLNKSYPALMRIDADMCETARVLQRGSLFERAQARDATGEYRQIRKKLDEVCDGMQREAKMLLGAFERVQEIDKGITIRQTAAKNSPPPSDIESD